MYICLPHHMTIFFSFLLMLSQWQLFSIRSFGKIKFSIQMNSGPSKKWNRSKETEWQWEWEGEGEIITPFQIGHLIHLLLVCLFFFCYFEEKTDSSSWCLCYFYFFIWDHLDDSDGLLQIHSRFLILISFDLVLLRCAANLSRILYWITHLKQNNRNQIRAK